MYKIVLLILFVSAAAAGGAQLCTGSLGDPVVNITFGAGANPGRPLAAATVQYQYTTDPCPVNGYYAVLNSGVECNYGWHVLPRDHTGDPNGYFLLVDAAFEPNDFYVDTVKNLCPNTTYEFAAWMLNMKYVPIGIRPDITFYVETPDGVVLQEYNTGSIPVEPTITWRQYGFYFTTPNTPSPIVLRMKNTARGGEGNDLALDDITFRPCGPVITSAILGNSDTVHVCEGDTGRYTFTADASAAYRLPVYQWQVSTDSGKNWRDIAGATAPSYLRMPTGAGAYWYRAAVTEQPFADNKICRIASNNLVVNVHPKPYVNAGNDRIIFSGDTVHLNATITSENPTLQWQPADYLSDDRIANPVAAPVATTTYTLHAESRYGCKQKDAITLKVVGGIFVPTAFTPNNDGNNDRWRIPYLDPMLGASVQVYNRWGQLVYSAKSTIVDWDGTVNGQPQPPGTYIYHIRFTRGRKDMQGFLQLLR